MDAPVSAEDFIRPVLILDNIIFKGRRRFRADIRESFRVIF